MTLVPLALVAALAQGPASPSQSPTRDENLLRCKGTLIDARLAGCSALIASGQESPADLAVHYDNRGTAHLARGLHDLALQDYNEAIKLNPAFAAAIGNRGIIMMVTRRFAEAIPDFTKAIELDATSTYAMYGRGLAYEAMGLDDLAIEDFSSAIQADPRDLQSLERRGAAYFRKRELDKAMADYQQVLSVDPQHAPALYGRGIIKRINGDAAGGGADLADARRLQADIDQMMMRAGVREK